jgi:hypothetical protein
MGSNKNQGQEDYTWNTDNMSAGEWAATGGGEESRNACVVNFKYSTAASIRQQVVH